MLTVLQGDCRDVLKTLPDESVHCVVTSPPYWGLRDYGTARWEGGREGCNHLPDRSSGIASSTLDGGKATANHQQEGWKGKDCGKCGARRIDSQLGLESTPEEYVAQMVGIFREVRRVLRSDGTCWLNLGDSYNSGAEIGRHDAREKVGIGATSKFFGTARQYGQRNTGLKPKDLCGIPWLVAFALRADGWYLRSEIIWHKPNPMPESVTDRPTKSHEQIFLLTKSARYFYDAEAIKETSIYGGDIKYGLGSTKDFDKTKQATLPRGERLVPMNRNRRSVWTIATSPYSDAHFATFPPKLVEPCILAGTSARGCCAECGAPWERVVETARTFESGSGRSGNGISGKQPPVQGAGYGDIRLGPTITSTTTGWQPTCEHEHFPVIPCTVLDPFAGSGTVGKVALELGRKAILIELNPKYCEMIQKRSEVTLGLPGLA